VIGKRVGVVDDGFAEGDLVGPDEDDREGLVVGLDVVGLALGALFGFRVGPVDGLFVPIGMRVGVTEGLYVFVGRLVVCLAVGELLIFEEGMIVCFVGVAVGRTVGGAGRAWRAIGMVSSLTSTNLRLILMAVHRIGGVMYGLIVMDCQVYPL